ncbi:MAG: tRNA (guanosine(46)-N7)-methyltransferase TrmB [Bacteroidales bacterium]|nr:tRNA (guanosine(46)-N7)-methyltransferase TrmB [Bacteroidales bacterium]
MAKKKLARFEESKSFPNLIQAGYFDLLKDYPLKGKWAENYFGNTHPIVLELGCGKGEYTVSLAEKNKSLNFIGIDNKGARLWRGCKNAIENHFDNVCFIRTKIEQIERFFAPGEISEIWITFPDPQPGSSGERKRLTSPRFLNHYKNFLKPDSIIHLKTDNTPLFEYTLETIASQGHQLIFHSFDLYGLNLEDDASGVQTFYEKMFLEQGISIKYLRFKLNQTQTN